MVIKAVSIKAAAMGIAAGTVVADARAIFPDLEVQDDRPQLPEQLLKALGEWCIRFTPVVSVSLPDSLILDVSGCPQLWGGDQPYLKEIYNRITALGYHIHVAIADTIGAAWALCHFANKKAMIVAPGKHTEALLPLPPAALRLDEVITEKLLKLGFRDIGRVVQLPVKALRRRFGQSLLTRIDQAFGREQESIEPLCPIAPYLERLPSLEGIRTATGIAIALKKLLETLCRRLEQEGKGVRKCIFKTYRVDGRQQQVEIGTSRASRNVHHLFRLFEEKIKQFAPGLGIELFALEATIVEDLPASQEALWNAAAGSEEAIAELVDRITGKVGADSIHRYLPSEHHWPEWSVKPAASLAEQPQSQWPAELPRPLELLATPQPIQVTVRIPDYPPMLFHYGGKLHRVRKADGPERIEQEWWLQNGQFRDYYCLEDEEGGRYWVFRSGHYDKAEPQWYLHGFFA